MKESKQINIHEVAANRNQIIREIVDFYLIQPGVSESVLEKLEEYLVLMNSFVIEALKDAFYISYGEANQLDIVDLLNTYINSVIEESDKIFKDEELDIQPLIYDEDHFPNEIQILEYIKKLNQTEKDRFGIKEQIEQLDENLYGENFAQQLLGVVQKLIGAIHSEIIVRVEDLI